MCFQPTTQNRRVLHEPQKSRTPAPDNLHRHGQPWGTIWGPLFMTLGSSGDRKQLFKA